MYHKVFDGVLSYKLIYYTKGGVLFDDKFEKNGFIASNIKLPSIVSFMSILRLKKQRYLFKHCGKVFTLRDNITQYRCYISNNTKYQIALDLTKKRSEVDIANDNNVSPNTVERVMGSFYKTQKLYKNHLPEVLLFHEFKYNTFNTNYHNSYIEGNNNYIKVIKRIAFGFRSFIRFKTRILICKGLLTIKKMANT